jgi:hypothetical protein
MGEVPPRVLLRVADTLQWNNDDQAAGVEEQVADEVVQGD